MSLIGEGSITCEEGWFVVRFTDRDPYGQERVLVIMRASDRELAERVQRRYSRTIGKPQMAAAPGFNDQPQARNSKKQSAGAAFRKTYVSNSQDSIPSPVEPSAAE